jgi:transposase-like protein
MAAEPTTLQEAIVYFNDPDNCIAYLVARRWRNGVACPTCGSARVSYLSKVRRWQCSARHSQRQFTLKTGTIMEDSPLGLDKWLAAMWLLLNCKNGISSYEIARGLGISQKSAWHMMHRVRRAFHGGPFEKLSGEVEADETFIGGKARNMHASKRAAKISGTGPKDKTAVMGILERGGKVRATVVPNRKKKALQAEVRKHVEAGSAIYTDALKSYEGLDEFQHGVVDHAVQYVDGKIHTNGLENFWSLLKRGLNGTYISVEPFHLFRYIDEQAFRYNNRIDMNDADRFNAGVSLIVGKRLTWDQLTGKTNAPLDANDVSGE